MRVAQSPKSLSKAIGVKIVFWHFCYVFISLMYKTIQFLFFHIRIDLNLPFDIRNLQKIQIQNKGHCPTLEMPFSHKAAKNPG